MTLLALDLATNVGWCKGDGSRKPQSGSFLLPSTGKNVGSFLEAYHRWLIDNIQDVSKLTFEAPILGLSQNINSVSKLHGLATHTEWVAHRKGIPCRSVVPLKIKKPWLGKSPVFPKNTKSAIKKQPMIDRAIELGFTPDDSDEADAIALWFYVQTEGAGPAACEQLAAKWR